MSTMSRTREAGSIALGAAMILGGVFGLVEYMRRREAQRQLTQPGPLPGDAGR
jgi:uncharacterized membrane protein HdeD (DUF308 family)